LLRAGLGPLGIRQAWQDLRAGYSTGTASSLAWTVGVALGAWRGWSLPLHEGRFITEEVLRDLIPLDLQPSAREPYGESLSA
jgi:hypothetical protein